MDYFFMNESIFKILVLEHKNFILDLLDSINIHISDYDVFDLNIKNTNQKIDILLFSNELIINFQLNKQKKSLIRNQIYLDCLSKILYSYKLIQININLFEEEHIISKNYTIFNYYQINEYINFLTSKDYTKFKTTNKSILKVQKYFQKIPLKSLESDIKKINNIKDNLDNLFIN